MPQTIKTLLTQAIQQAPSADNSQPWRIDWHENTLTISYDTARVSNNTFAADNPATLLSIGAAIENLLQAAYAYKIPTDCQITKQFNPLNPVYCICHITAPQDPLEEPVLPLPLHQRHTNRCAYSTQHLAPLSIDSLESQTLNGMRIKVIEQHKKIMEVSKLVRLASEIRFRTQEINEWLGKSFRFGRQAELTNDGLDVETLNLPLGGSLFLRFISNWKRMKLLNLLGAYKFMSFIDSSPIKQAPALVAIIGPSGFHESLSAGQLMQRTWISLNAQGIAVHPYYVISDQINRYQAGTVPKKLENQASQVLNSARNILDLPEKETLHMLFRIGYPKKTAKRSRRLALQKICPGINIA